MLNRALIAVILAAIAVASNGASRATASNIFPQDRPGPSEPPATESAVQPGDEVREEFHQTYPLSATGRVSVENINGFVQIKVWDRAAVQLDAVKKAWRREYLADAKIEVNATEENIRIKTEYPDNNFKYEGRYERPAIVDYTLTVPRKVSLDSVELVNGSLDIDGVEGNVKASSINGRVTARGLAGETKLSTINGPLTAVFTQLPADKLISLGSVNGSVTLVIPSNANASIRAGTVHGGISNDFGLQVKHGEWVGHNLDGQLGNGGAKIKLGNVNGGIRITHAQDGLALTPVTSVSSEAASESVAVSGSDIASAVTEATRAAVEATSKIQVDVRVAQQAQRQAQREVEQALREAQREIERAQREINKEKVKVKVKGTGAASGSGSGSGSGEGSGSYGGRVTAQETKTFTVNGASRINVSTFDGQVTVHGWDKSEVTYTALKRANSDEELKAITIVSEQQGAAISVLAQCDNGRDGTVNFEVYVPRRATLHVSSGDGQLKLDGVNGDITLRSGDGGINVIDAGGTLQVNTGDGPIQVLRFDGQVDARTGDGEITLDGNFNSLEARTGDGTISLSVPASSNFTVETNAEDDVNNEGLSVTEDITPTRRVRRWRVGAGGRVFVLKTGDGKILLRSR